MLFYLQFFKFLSGALISLKQAELNKSSSHETAELASPSIVGLHLIQALAFAETIVSTKFGSFVKSAIMSFEKVPNEFYVKKSAIVHL